MIWRKALHCTPVASLLVLLSTAFFAAAQSYGEAADRVTQPIDTTQVRALPNHVPAWANANNLVSPIPSNSTLDQMTIVLSRSPEQEQELAALCWQTSRIRLRLTTITG